MPSWLSAAEANPSWIDAGARLEVAVDRFTRAPGLRLLPVVDAEHRPIGAVFEEDVRRLLLNPYGHALMRNPSYGGALSRHIRACPTADAALAVPALIAAYRAANGSEGMILTRHGRLAAVLSNRRLLHLAAEHDRQAAAAQAVRAARIEAAIAGFEREAASLASTMETMATALKRDADATADRSVQVGGRALAVAGAAAQTCDAMRGVADHGAALAQAFAAISASTGSAKQAAAAVSALVAEGAARTGELRRTTHSIDSVLALIGEIAGRVNLLALNASIEAARAGAAGQGFQVVANEVKQLSAQSKVAAAQITAQIDTIRSGVDAVAEGHGEVAQAMARMTELATRIEAAVLAQESETRTMAGNVGEAMLASSGIQRDVEAIGEATNGAAERAQAIGDLAARLELGAGTLARHVDTLLAEVRAA